MNPEAHKNISERKNKVRELLGDCQLCPRMCGVDRVKGESGYCGLREAAHCFREMLHWGEEKELVPSHQVYFTGCNLKCGSCTVTEWNCQPEAMVKMNLQELAQKVRQRQQEGARNLNLLGGEPAVNIAGILELLELISPKTKVVWNSNMYYNESVSDLLLGLVDIYLADFKCGDPECAEKILDAKDYIETAQRNLLEACRETDLIVRHVLLPGHSECCSRPILDWLADNIPKVKLSLRGDYVPPAEKGSAPTKYLKPEELTAAIIQAETMGLNVIR